MATVNGLTAERMLAIEAMVVNNAEIDENGHLIFYQHDGTQIDVGPIPALPDASESVKGVAELATFAEVAARTDAEKIVTPYTLGAANNIPIPLTAASFSQTTAFTSYPAGLSRLYYTSVNSGAWDFSGKAGEVLTYRDGTDFARQTFVKHQGGTTSDTALWIRTANAANGWSSWKKIARDVKLPDPQTVLYSNTITVSATSWADLPNLSSINLTLPLDAIVEVSFGAWLATGAGTSTDIRAGVGIDGGNPVDLFGGTWGNVPHVVNGSGQYNMSTVTKLSAGAHAFKARAYRINADSSVNYPMMTVNVQRWAE